MNIHKALKFLGLWIVNSMTVIILGTILSSGVVFGNKDVPSGITTFTTGLLLTIVVYIANIAVKKSAFTVGDPRIWIGVYFVFNSVVIWFLKRFADITGLGITNNLFVAIIAVVVSVGQWYVNKLANKLQDNKKK